MLVIQFQENPSKEHRDMDGNVYCSASKMLLRYSEWKQTNTICRAWELLSLREVEGKIVNEDDTQKKMFVAPSLHALFTDCSGWRISAIIASTAWMKGSGVVGTWWHSWLITELQDGRLIPSGFK